MKRSKHNLSHYRLCSADMGQLVPVACVEVLPGDTFRHTTSVLLRTTPLATPVMHPVSLRVHHWFVPNRIIWSSWEDFITGSDDELTIPTLDVANGASPGWDDLPDWLAYSYQASGANALNALPIRAYNKIWNTFYRDQDLQTERDEDDVTAARVCWDKDYFTAARTYPQFGADTLSIPLAEGSSAPVTGIGHGTQTFVSGGSNRYETDGTGATTYTNEQKFGTGAGEIWYAEQDPNNTGYPNIRADLSAASGGIDVNDFRRTMALQRFLEARNRFGSRHRDYLRYLGIRPRDGRLSEPEYLGGGKQSIAISEVLATTESTNFDVGQMAGHGIAALRTRPYTRFFEESGYVISLASVRPRTIYDNLTKRDLLRSTKDDYWQKEYEAFGPQAILTKEVYGAHTNATDIFGYNDRFAEYRREPSLVTGQFRAGELSDDWTMARTFSSQPSLNSAFVTCTPTDGIYQDTSEPEVIMQANHRLTARRLVSKHARY